jgi:hypothetical protein
MTVSASTVTDSSSVAAHLVSCVFNCLKDQRVNIKFCVKLGKTPTGTYAHSVCGEEALSGSSLSEWFKPVFLNLFKPKDQ